MKKISIVYTYFNQYEMLNILFKYYDRFLNKDFLKKLQFIIVDDCSDIYPAHLNFPETKNIDFSIWRTDYNGGFNAGGARNLGCYKAKYNNIVSLDIDMILTNELLKEIFIYSLTNTEYRRFYREGIVSIDLNTNTKFYKRLNSPYYIKKDLYLKYPTDEDFAGHYGYEDEYFRILLEHNKVKASFFTNGIITPPIRIHGYEKFPTPKHNPGYTRDLDRKGDLKINYKLYLKKKEQLAVPKLQLNFNYKLVT